MIFKDRSLLEEAYISASQKTVNVPPNVSSPDEEVEPLSPINQPTVGVSVQDLDQQSDCGCGGQSEEAEEDYMTKSNLFSLFSNAKKLHHLSMSGVKMEPWMQQKIAVCADNLESVFRSANYEAAATGLGCD